MPPTPSRAYHVLSTLGKGGFGTVYRAELRGEGGFVKAVALKVLNADMEGLDEIAQRMRDEARVLGLVRHRAIVQVDGLVRLNGRWTIVMELVHGVDLKLLADKSQVPPGPALELVGEIAGALHAAFTSPGPGGVPLKILHRDIKPSNVQLTALGEVKVLDFGIARADFEGREAVTRSLTFGSLEYMAPERMDLLDTPAGDIYALGAVLYELLSGQMLGKTSINPKRHEARLDERLLALRGRLGAGNGVEPLLTFLRAMLAYDHEQRPDAREVERQCARLRLPWPEPTLRDWAEDVVPDLSAQRKEQPADDLTGSTLYERTDSRSVLVPPTPASGEGAEHKGPKGGGTWAEPPAERERHGGTRWEPIEAGAVGRVESGPLTPGRTTTAPRHLPKEPASDSPDEPTPDPPPQAATEGGGENELRPAVRRSVLLFGAVALALGVGAVAAAGLGAWWFLGRPAPAPPTPAQPIAMAVEDPAAAPTPAPAATVPEAAEPEAPKATPAPAPSGPRRAPPAPTPTPVAEEAKLPPPVTAAPGGAVAFSGDATSVLLLSGRERHALPATVPPGSYEIEAVFPKRGQVRAGKLQVVDGTRVKLRCEDMFGRCSVE